MRTRTSLLQLLMEETKLPSILLDPLQPLRHLRPHQLPTVRILQSLRPHQLPLRRIHLLHNLLSGQPNLLANLLSNLLLRPRQQQGARGGRN